MPGKYKPDGLKPSRLFCCSNLSYSLFFELFVIDYLLKETIVFATVGAALFDALASLRSEFKF